MSRDSLKVSIYKMAISDTRVLKPVSDSLSRYRRCRILFDDMDRNVFLAENVDTDIVVDVDD